jgi:hypothetical protein
MSNINPNNIDQTYPIAGQDNDSQGFRDNFTNIKTNLGYAHDEIADLQGKVILKSALTGTTLNNDMGGALVSNAKLQGTRHTRVASTTSTGTATIDFSAGNYYTLPALTGNTTLAFTNLPSAGNYAEWVVQFPVTGTPPSYTLTFPSSVTIGTNNLHGYSSNVITFHRAGTYAYKFWTSDGGATIAVQDLIGHNPDPLFLPSHENVTTSGSALSLTNTTSHFYTSTASTATLATGSYGQMKHLIAANVAAGNMVVTVSNAGWKTSGTGTATFSSRGQGCILQYINGCWYAVGNNGVTFG